MIDVVDLFICLLVLGLVIGIFTVVGFMLIWLFEDLSGRKCLRDTRRVIEDEEI